MTDPILADLIVTLIADEDRAVAAFARLAAASECAARSISRFYEVAFSEHMEDGWPDAMRWTP